MYSAKSYQLKLEEYNYLLPVLKTNLLYSDDKYYFCGTTNQLDDMLNRLKGLYNFYSELYSMTIYNCHKNGNLEPFRNEVNKHSSNPYNKTFQNWDELFEFQAKKDGGNYTLLKDWLKKYYNVPQLKKDSTK